MKYDSISPEITIRMFSDEFLESCRRLKLQLTCSNTDFRKNMCEALCVMYIAHRQKTSWIGPKSIPPRPTKWTPQHEILWKDVLTQKYLSYEIWQNIWDRIPEAHWESSVPNWRINMEFIAIHYIAYKSEIMVNCIVGDDTESILSSSDEYSYFNDEYDST